MVWHYIAPSLPFHVEISIARQLHCRSMDSFEASLTFGVGVCVFIWSVPILAALCNDGVVNARPAFVLSLKSIYIISMIKPTRMIE